MIIDNIKGLLLGIFIVIVLLVCCMALDSADETYYKIAEKRIKEAKAQRRLVCV